MIPPEKKFAKGDKVYFAYVDHDGSTKVDAATVLKAGQLEATVDGPRSFFYGSKHQISTLVEHHATPELALRRFIDNVSKGIAATEARLIKSKHNLQEARDQLDALIASK